MVSLQSAQVFLNRHGALFVPDRHKGTAKVYRRLRQVIGVKRENGWIKSADSARLATGASEFPSTVTGNILQSQPIRNVQSEHN